MRERFAFTIRDEGEKRGRPDHDPDGLVLEAWAQGFMVGTLVFMAAITIANMRRRMLLHKLILAELLLGIGHGTFIFFHEPVYGWYLSCTAIGLNMSWTLHNIIAWLKNRPFMSRRVSMIYIGTVILAQPYWVLEIYANFAFFNNINDLFLRTRPWEPLFRDPWWIYTTCNLFWVIKSQYDFGISELLRNGPRFGIMLIAMCISIIFIIFDTLSVLRVLKGALPTGINPFWKLSFVFKCLCDAVVLDDFKTALDRLRDYWLAKNGVEVEGTERQSKSNAAATPVNRSRFWRNSAGIIEPLELKRQQKDDTNCSSSGLSQENQVTPFGHL
ncbi:uncharacterized protein CIMG_01963 [Coccidioides immitis RS]|uniref:Integral membrane protein n=5 Tax=Coccidioides TaxID=5500 RepID=J3KKC4_COCIM|nr:uncharacterized protein CIMG_01963 [Coccidioides immitis RS]EFW16757.1 conserved hypothetical protein [Coccidioides posadasii str. Silveira]KMM64482.1 hypothetical protein CPAG_00834 [Coccidioides posadasii RMSCC 3488]KMU79873.1 hypothetical protein CISG_07945 [Coccidioides immitis RMSCC 3703]KMU88163.1 hypothetical protein CIHG_05334 [Coccidioides immitis H538.4]TPX25298.1 hypothetical protein DIZ76_010749 [Coccidioides immitis]